MYVWTNLKKIKFNFSTVFYWQPRYLQGERTSLFTFLKKFCSIALTSGRFVSADLLLGGGSTSLRRHRSLQRLRAGPHHRQAHLRHLQVPLPCNATAFPGVQRFKNLFLFVTAQNKQERFVPGKFLQARKEPTNVEYLAHNYPNSSKTCWVETL